MIINNLYVGGTLVGPDEAEPPLIVDADTMLALPISLESFKSIRWGRLQVAKVARRMQHVQLAKRLFLDCSKLSRRFPAPKSFDRTVPERRDHAGSLSRPVLYGNRYTLGS